MSALNERFQRYTLKLFKKHGIEVIGFWVAIVGASNSLYYMIAFEDMAHKEKAWNAFIKDPEWIKVRSETEREGPIVERVINLLLKPTGYSPMK